MKAADNIAHIGSYKQNLSNIQIQNSKCRIGKGHSIKIGHGHTMPNSAESLYFQQIAELAIYSLYSDET